MQASDQESGRFSDRREAGRFLATRLGAYADRDDAIVLGLPRGGVPVAYEIAEALRLPLDLFIVRKLGVPGHEELAMGAIATGGVRVVDERLALELGLDEATIARVAAEEQRQLEERERLYRDGRGVPELGGKTALLVDDGLATGSSMRAAVRAVRSRDPAAILVAVPVAPPETCASLADEADEVVCAVTPERFHAVGVWYRDFGQTSDDEVRRLLAKAHAKRGPAPVARGAWRG